MGRVGIMADGGLERRGLAHTIPAVASEQDCRGVSCKHSGNELLPKGEDSGEG